MGVNVEGPVRVGRGHDLRHAVPFEGDHVRDWVQNGWSADLVGNIDEEPRVGGLGAVADADRDPRAQIPERGTKLDPAPTGAGSRLIVNTVAYAGPSTLKNSSMPPSGSVANTSTARSVPGGTLTTPRFSATIVAGSWNHRDRQRLLVTQAAVEQRGRWRCRRRCRSSRERPAACSWQRPTTDPPKTGSQTVAPRRGSARLKASIRIRRLDALRHLTSRFDRHIGRRRKHGRLGDVHDGNREQGTVMADPVADENVTARGSGVVEAWRQADESGRGSGAGSTVATETHVGAEAMLNVRGCPSASDAWSVCSAVEPSATVMGATGARLQRYGCPAPRMARRRRRTSRIELHRVVVVGAGAWLPKEVIEYTRDEEEACRSKAVPSNGDRHARKPVRAGGQDRDGRAPSVLPRARSPPRRCPNSVM